MRIFDAAYPAKMALVAFMMAAVLWGVGLSFFDMEAVPMFPINPAAGWWCNLITALMWAHLVLMGGLIIGYVLLWIPGVWQLMDLACIVLIPSCLILIAISWVMTGFSVANMFWTLWPGANTEGS